MEEEIEGKKNPWDGARNFIRLFQLSIIYHKKKLEMRKEYETNWYCLSQKRKKKKIVSASRYYESN